MYLLQQNGCYQYTGSSNCSSGCGCQAEICGLTALIISAFYPKEAITQKPVPWPCGSTHVEEDCARHINGLVRNLVSAVEFWQRLCIGLGVVSLLLLAGLIYALLFR
jgi:hypothetical protein